MFAQQRAEGTVRPSQTRSPRSLLLGQLPSLLVVCLAGGLVAGFFLSFYRLTGYTMPIGWDTARYLDQTNLVASHGLHGVSHLTLPRPSHVLTSRAGFPVLVLTLSRLLTGSTFQIAAVAPIAGISAAGLAAGAFVSYGLRRGAWELAAVVVVVGLSATFVRMIAGTYMDNILSAAVFSAALVPLLAWVRDGKGLVATVALFGLGGVIHSFFFLFVLGVLVVTAFLYGPASWRRWRRHEVPVLATPSSRLGAVVAGSAGVAAFTIYGVLRTTPAQPEGILSRKASAARLREDLPLYRLALTTPLALLGLGAVGVDATPARRPSDARVGTGPSDRSSATFVLTLSVAWIGTALAAIAAFYLLRKNWPPHRLLSFMLPLPILVALGILGVGRLVAARPWKVARAAGVAVVIAALLVMGGFAVDNLFGTLKGRGIEWIDEIKIKDAATALSYLDAVHVPPAAPVVYLIDDSGPNAQEYLPELAHIMRAAMPAERIEHAYFYIGTPDEYMAGRPTLLRIDDRHFNTPSLRFWNALQPVLPQHPVALLLSSYNVTYLQSTLAHPDWLVAPNVLVVNGPRPARDLTAAPFPSAPVGTFKLAGFGIGVLVTLSLIGIGWAVALLPRGVRPFELLALSSGFGIAFLVAGGIVADAAGLRLGNGAAVMVPVGVALVGWALAARRVSEDPQAWLAGTCA